MENELEVVNIRLVKEPSLYSEQTLDSPQAVVELMAKELSQYDREVFCILNMKNNGQVINMNLVSVGTINASLVIPREVFKSSILANASAIIGLHNHPSGNVKPSKEDMIVTRKLQKCGQLLGIELLDHIIVGGTNGKMLSFREEKMLNVTSEAFLEKCDRERIESFAPLFEGSGNAAQAARAALLPNTFLQALVCRALTGPVLPEVIEE